MDRDLTFVGYTAVLNINEPTEPTSFQSDVAHPQWREAMTEEFLALKKQGTWELVPMPSDRNIIGRKWVYKLKRDQNGNISRYKAWLVA